MRWQVSGILMYLVMYPLKDIELSLLIPIAQLIGAMFFYKLDEWILKDED